MGFSLRVYAFTMGLLLLASAVDAQVPGDSIRYRLRSTRKWHDGRIVRVDDTTLVVRRKFQEEPCRRDDVSGLLVWRRKALGRSALFGAVGGIAVWGIGQAISDDTSTITGSPAGDIAISAVFGALVGMMEHAIDPGDWHRVY